MINSSIQNAILEAGQKMTTILINLSDNTKELESDIWKEMEPYYLKEIGSITILYALEVKTKEFIGININQINDIIITNHIFSANTKQETLGDLLDLTM